MAGEKLSSPSESNLVQTVTATSLTERTKLLLRRATWRRILLRIWFYKSKFTDANLLIVKARTQLQGTEGLSNLFLVLWFVLNITITLSSKLMFTDFKFPYPMMLTAVHLATTWMGAQLASMTGLYKSSPMSASNFRAQLLFSLIFTLNIWLSNYGLLVSSISVHQVFRTTIPLITMLLSFVLYNEHYPKRMLPSVLLVIGGVAITVWGDLEMTLWGAVAVAMGCLMSSLKGLMTQKAQIGAQGVQTLDLLRTICPLAILELIIWGTFNGEIQDMITQTQFDFKTAQHLCFQGLLALGMNFVSFKCAALKNPLTMNVAGNVKQVLTPLVAFSFMDGTLTQPLVLGLIMTLVGALWYGNEAAVHKKQRDLCVIADLERGSGQASTSEGAPEAVQKESE